MSSFTQLCVHLIFSTKNREPIIEDAWKAQLHSYMAGVCGNLGSFKQCIGGISDHLHLLINLPCTMTIADFVKQLNRASVHWIQNEMNAPHFKWQEEIPSVIFGYSAPSGAESLPLRIRQARIHLGCRLQYFGTFGGSIQSISSCQNA